MTAPQLAKEFAAWCASELIVPSGLLQGRPFKIPRWQEKIVAGVLSRRTREAYVCTARKNGKSGLVAAVLLGYLAPGGPLRRDTKNWRGLVVSLTAQLAGELRRQLREIVDASGIEGVKVYRSPMPGRIKGAAGSSVTLLAADRGSGHGAGIDLAVIDEAGLLPERRRELWEAVASSTSARNGRLLGISILGDGPMFREALARAGEPGVKVWRYEAPESCGLDNDPRLEAGQPRAPQRASSLKAT